jgi:hypothetical protein
VGDQRQTYKVKVWELPVTTEDLNKPLEKVNQEPRELPTPYPDLVIEFPDENLETVVREETGKGEGSILFSDVQGIEILSATGRYIQDIEPLRYFINRKSCTYPGIKSVTSAPLATSSAL